MHLGLHISKPDQGSHPKNCSKPKCTQCTPHLCSYQTGMTKKIVKKKGGKLQWCCDRWNDVAASSRRMTSLLSCAVHNLCCMLHYTRGPRDEALTRGCRLTDMAQPWVTDHQKKPVQKRSRWQCSAIHTSVRSGRFKLQRWARSCCNT